jgi:beta-lactamase regulating signal transducer with metallopeptidase domain
MLIHEFEHVKQGHSIDILVLEVLTVFQWFNPFFWLLKRLLRENHEYLADRAVLVHFSNPGYYKKLLLQQFVGPQIDLANNFNYSLIKKRIQMMSQIKSSKLARIKLFGGIFLASTLIVIFACEQEQSTTSLSGATDQTATVEYAGASLTIGGDSVAV